MEREMNEEVTSEKNIEYPNTENVTEETQCKQQIDDSEICITTEVQKLYSVDTNPDREDNEQNNTKSEKVQHDSSKDTFKKPVLIIGPRRGHPSKLRTVSQGAVVEAFKNSEAQSNDTSRPVLALQSLEKQETPVELPKDKKLLLPYSEPSWSGIPDRIYKLEILKSGVILETIDLSSKNYHVVGRLPACDISMAHPTISRYHAIFQYRFVSDEKNGKGMYVYDLGSTHGTFWNGNRVKPKVYVRLQGGHIIRFGCSQRKFIIQAPPDDQEKESEYTVTELKEMRRIELEEREKLEKQRLLEEEEQKRLQKEKEDAEGIDWGMGEDADEETDLTENPYAQTNNEELFFDDPKKTLRGWFEREGLDLQYQTEDKGTGRFLCWVEVPIDDRTIRAEALVTGKKKEAVIQCALEACRLLDRHGLLRQANHESRKRKSRNWEEEDFYDSDEDIFLDRTGTVEKKREQRMRMAGKLETKAETYDSLLDKHSKVTEKITNIENTIALHKMNKNEMDHPNTDALDAFMSSLDSSTLDKTEIRKLKIELINLRKEEMQLLKLINIAKPANLPPLKPHVPLVATKLKSDFKDLKSVVGHVKKTKCNQNHETVSPMVKEDQNMNKSEHEEDSDEMTKERLEETEKNYNSNEEESKIERKEKIILNNDNTEFIPTVNNTTMNDIEEIELEKEISKKKKRNIKRNHQKIDKATELQKNYGEEFSEDYSMWVPPDNQSGDGKTSLNEKFGY